MICQDMITIQDLYNIVGNKIGNEAQKTLIRNNFPRDIAEQMCNAKGNTGTGSCFINE